MEVKCFIDNDTNMQDKTIHNIPVFSTDRMITGQSLIDAVIISIEGDHDVTIKNQLESLLDSRISVFSRKDVERA
jgi:hypothetical protein